VQRASTDPPEHQENLDMRRPTLVLAFSVMAACGTTTDRAADSASGKAAVPTDTGMPMHAMPARATSGTMAAEMRVHLQAMKAMSADSMRARLSMHQQMADAMMAQMSTEMAGMKMPSDPRWSALMDSVHQDLARMPGMNGVELETTMAAHHARITRLMDMHSGMMGRKVPPR
jgi:hypothetical protein